MQLTYRALSILIAAVASSSACEEALSKPSEKQKLEQFYKLNPLLKALSINGKSNLFSGPIVYCDKSSPCLVDATVIELFDRSGLLASCVVQTSDINVDFGVNPKKGDQIQITWNLVTPATSAAYKFESPGLLIVKDDYASTGGKADDVKDNEVYIYDKWKKHNAIIVYYPIVIQTTSDGSTSLCAARDPLIVN